MKKWLIVLTICLAAATALAYGPPSVNPQLPAQNTPLTAQVVQGNFQKTYNDLVSIFNVLNGLGSASTLNSPIQPQNGGTGLSSLCPDGDTIVSTGTAYHCVASGGGGTGLTSEQIVTTGTSATATCGEFVGFNSGSGGAKTLNIPAPTGSLCLIVTSDMYGDAGLNAITAVPVSGTIFGSTQVYTTHGSITLLDTSAGWVSI